MGEVKPTCIINVIWELGKAAVYRPVILEWCGTVFPVWFPSDKLPS